jgi:hypothetical protein
MIQKWYASIRRNYWRLLAFLENFFIGDRNWGEVRLVIVLLVLLVFILTGRLVFGGVNTLAIAEGWQARYPMLGVVPKFILQFLSNGVVAQGLRYLVIPLAAFAGALFVGAHYVQDIYELEKFQHGLRYLLAILFGIDYPKLTIDDGKVKVKKGETNLLNAVGGPGFARILPGNVVLFEHLTGPTNVRARGKHFIPRQEKIKAIADLNDQHGHIQETLATTKDGIVITLQDVHFRYRLRTGRKLGDYTERTPEDPHPYSVQSVRNMAYNRNVDAEGLRSWHSDVASAIRGLIASYINQHQLDQLLGPYDRQVDPRVEIAERLNSLAMRERLRALGAELLWFDIGHFDIPAEAKQQLVSTWGEQWIGSASITRAKGAAERLIMGEKARADLQAQFLKHVSSVLSDIDMSPDSTENLRAIILARTAQIIESLPDQTPDDGE